MNHIKEVQVNCRYCLRHLGGTIVGNYVRWEECDDGTGCKSNWDQFWSSSLVLAKPIRAFRQALRFWRPKRLTLKSNPRVHAWLWWNF